MLYSVFSQSRKTHISPNGEGDTFCRAEKKWSWLVWDCGGEMSRLQVGLIEKGIDPDDYICKTCMRMAQAHLTKRAVDLRDSAASYKLSTPPANH